MRTLENEFKKNTNIWEISWDEKVSTTTFLINFLDFEPQYVRKLKCSEIPYPHEKDSLEIQETLETMLFRRDKINKFLTC